MAIFGQPAATPFDEANQRTQDQQQAFAGIKDNLPALGLIAGLSMLARNNGSRSVGQLIGQAGSDALGAYGTWQKIEQAKARQKMLDDIAAEERQYNRSQDAFQNDMAMRKFWLEEAKMAQDMNIQRQRLALAQAGVAAQRNAQAQALALAQQEKDFKEKHREVNGVWYDKQADGTWLESPTLNMYDQKTGKRIGANATPLYKPSEFNTIKKNYDDEQSDYLAIGRSLQNVFALVQDPTMADDLALVYNVQRANDPRSVVRETEFDMAQRTGSLWDQARAKLKEMTGDGRLTQEQRMNMLRSVYKQYVAHEKTHRDRVDKFWSVVLPKMGMDLSDIINTSYYSLHPQVKDYLLSGYNK